MERMVSDGDLKMPLHGSRVPLLSNFDDPEGEISCSDGDSVLG